MVANLSAHPARDLDRILFQLEAYNASSEHSKENYKNIKLLYWPSGCVSRTILSPNPLDEFDNLRYSLLHDTSDEVGCKSLDRFNTSSTLDVLKNAYDIIEKKYNEVLKSDTDLVVHHHFTFLFHYVHMTRFEFRYFRTLNMLHDLLNHWSSRVIQTSLLEKVDAKGVSYTDTIHEILAHVRDLANQRAVFINYHAKWSLSRTNLNQEYLDSQDPKITNIISDIYSNFGHGYKELLSSHPDTHALATMKSDGLGFMGLDDFSSTIEDFFDDILTEIVGSNQKAHSLHAMVKFDPQKAEKVRQYRNNRLKWSHVRDLAIVGLCSCGLYLLAIYTEGVFNAAVSMSMVFMCVSVICHSVVIWLDYCNKCYVNDLYSVPLPPVSSHDFSDRAEVEAHKAALYEGGLRYEQSHSDREDRP